MTTDGQAVAKTLKALGDSIHVVRDSLVQATAHLQSALRGADAQHPVVIQTLEPHEHGLIAVITHPAFNVGWPLLTGVVAFAAGRLYERWNDNRKKNHERWTAARLARRYVLDVQDQMRGLAGRMQAVENTGAAHVEYVLKSIGEFENINTRMVAFESDEVEDAISKWHRVATDNLTEVHDALTMTGNEYVTRYKIKTVAAVRWVALKTALELDVEKATEVIAKLAPFLRLRKEKKSKQ